MTQLVTQIAFRKAGRVSVGRDRLLSLIEIALEPLLLPLSLWTIDFYLDSQIAPESVILGVVVFAMTFPAPARLSQSPLRAIRNILGGWVALAGLMAFFGYISGYLERFDLHVLVTWWWTAPATSNPGSTA